MVERKHPAGKSRWNRCFKAVVCLCVFAALVLFSLPWALPWVAERLIEREGAKRTGHPVSTEVRHVGLRGASLGETGFHFAGTDVRWHRLELRYRISEIREGWLETVRVVEPTLTVDIGGFEGWLRRLAQTEPDPPERDEEPVAPPPRPPEVEVDWVPPPLPHPALLWETPLLLSRLRHIPAHRASAEAGRLKAFHGEVLEAMDFDLFFRRGEDGEEAFFRLKGPHIFQRFEAWLPRERGDAVLRLAGSVVDGVEWLRGLLPPTTALHPDRWLGADAEARLPEILWEAAVETRGDRLRRGGGLIEARDLTYGSDSLRCRFESLFLGFQLGPRTVENLSFGMNGFALAGAGWRFAPEQVSLFYSADTDEARLEIPRASLFADGLLAAETALRAGISPRTDWWTSPVEGEIGFRDVTAAGFAADPFAIRLTNEGTLLRGEVTPLRWAGHPPTALVDTRFVLESPFSAWSELEVGTTVARSGDSSPVARGAMRVLMGPQRIRAAWDLHSAEDDALGGGTFARPAAGQPWEAAWSLTLPGAFLDKAFPLLGDFVPLSEAAGTLRVSGEGVASDHLDARASVEVILDALSFLVADLARFTEVSGTVALQWVGLPAMEKEQTLRAASVRVGDILIEDARLRVHWPLPHRFEILEITGRALGGTARVEPVTLNPLDGFEGDFTLIFEDIDAAAVADLFPDERYRVEGRLSGVLPVNFSGGHLRPLHGYLEMAPGSEARIRLLDPDLRRQVLSGIADDPRLGIREKMSAALREGIPLHAYSIDLFDPATPAYPAVVRARGGVHTHEIRAESISFRLNYALRGVDWQDDFAWFFDLLRDFQAP